ncbi:MAG: DegT/DnrJ/EryC1/StrS family aminotransferase, partial [Acidobacteriaceae bacterium]
WPRNSGSLGSGRFLFLSQNYRMSELPGAVARAQLKKVTTTVERRRARAAQLTRILDGIDGVSAPSTPPGVNPAYWLYMLRVEESSGENTQAFGDALIAEGVPAWVRYIVDPLYLSPMFTGPKTYGTSGYPFSQYHHQTFKRGLCPQAEAALSNVIAIHWNENYTSEHVEQIGAAIRKVAHHFPSAVARR